jgi:hypothetical protein
LSSGFDLGRLTCPGDELEHQAGEREQRPVAVGSPLEGHGLEFSVSRAWPVALRKALDLIEDLSASHSYPHIRSGRRRAPVVAVHHRLLRPHPGLGKKRERPGARAWLSIATVPAGDATPRILATMKLPIRACSSISPAAISRLKCLLSDFSSKGLAGLGVDHQLTNLFLRYPQSGQDFDTVTLFGGRYESFSPSAAWHSRH